MEPGPRQSLPERELRAESFYRMPYLIPTSVASPTSNVRPTQKSYRGYRRGPLEVQFAKSRQFVLRQHSAGPRSAAAVLDSKLLVSAEPSGRLCHLAALRCSSTFRGATRRCCSSRFEASGFGRACRSTLPPRVNGKASIVTKIDGTM